MGIYKRYSIVQIFYLLSFHMHSERIGHSSQQVAGQIQNTSVKSEINN